MNKDHISSKSEHISTNTEKDSLNAEKKLATTEPILEANTAIPSAIMKEKEKKALILEAYRALGESEPHKAIKFIQDAKLIDSNDNQVHALYSGVNYWIKKIEENVAIQDSISKGDNFVKFWGEFIVKQENYSHSQNFPLSLNVEHISRLKSFVFTLARACYAYAAKSYPQINNDVEFQLKYYHCLKNLGEYQRALQLIHGICSKYNNSAMLCSELADCYYLTKNINNAKILFREAFFINPTEIRLENVEADIILELVKLIKKFSYPSTFLRDWIPVFGYVTHTFNIIREIKPIELQTLKNDISNMEAKLVDHRALGHDDANKILPALLNKYFWLIEHYKKSNNPNNEANVVHIQLIYNKIKVHDEIIYEMLLSS